MEAQPSHSSSTPIVSRVLALALRRLGDDWLQHHRNPIQLVESFVDGSLFPGTCYKACGFGRASRDFYFEHGEPMQLFRRQIQRMWARAPPSSSPPGVSGRALGHENGVQYRRDVSFEENQCG